MFLTRADHLDRPLTQEEACPPLLRKFTAFLTRGGVPTAPKKVYTVSTGWGHIGCRARDHQDVASKPPVQQETLGSHPCVTQNVFHVSEPF